MSKVRVIADPESKRVSLNFPETCLGCYQNKTGPFEILLICISNINDLLFTKNLHRVKIPACQQCFTRHKRWYTAQMIFQVTTFIAVVSALILGFTKGESGGEQYVPYFGTLLGIGLWGTIVCIVRRQFLFKTRLLAPNLKGIDFKITEPKCLDGFINLNKIEHL